MSRGNNKFNQKMSVWSDFCTSLHSRRLEVMDPRKNGARAFYF